MRDVSPCSESIKVRCGRQASLHRDPFIECNALGNSPTILRCAKPSLLLRDYANYMKPVSHAASARHGGCAPCIILYFLVDFSSLLTSYPCHFIAYRNYPPPAQQSTAGLPVSPHVLVPKQGPSCHQKMGDLNLSLTEECAEVFCICPVNPPNSSSSSDSVSLLTSCVPSNTIFTSHISGLFY